MRCPFCGNEESQVKDSRPTDDNSSIRRRRVCAECGARFTTFERVQLREMTVVKAGSRKQPFEREKLAKSLRVALMKRPVDTERIDKIVTSIVRQLESFSDSEVPSETIGDLAMKALAEVDKVGYIRYASVYKNFANPEDFNEFIEEIKDFKITQPDSNKKVAV